ncbi:hypothetical protein D3C80_2229090 [compost metagenome]
MIQADRLLSRAQPGIDIEPGALKQSEMLASYPEQQDRQQADNRKKYWQAQDTTHSGQTLKK